MFSSTSVVLRAVSCIVRKCSLSVCSEYGVTACTISKGGIKDAVLQYLVSHFRQHFKKFCPTLFSLVF